MSVFVCAFKCGLYCFQFEKHGRSLENTKLKLLEAANLVDKVIFSMKATNRHRHLCLSHLRLAVKFWLRLSSALPQYYKTLNIRVALIGLEVWTNGDMISISDNPHSTLAAFLSWRSKQLRTLPNDNAQLITSVASILSFLAISSASDYPAGTNHQWHFVFPGGGHSKALPLGWLLLKPCALTTSLVE